MMSQFLMIGHIKVRVRLFQIIFCFTSSSITDLTLTICPLYALEKPMKGWLSKVTSQRGQGVRKKVIFMAKGGSFIVSMTIYNSMSLLVALNTVA